MMRICIVAHNAFGVMTGDVSKHVGGVEVQTRLLAEWLAKNNFDVSVLTWDDGPVTGGLPSRVRLRTVCGRDDGVPGIRFFHPRWTSLVTALAESDADIYFQSGAEYFTGQIALWCRRHRKKFVFSVASDMDCDTNLPLLTSIRERVLYRIGLKLADKVFSQTRNQRACLKEGFGVDSIFLPMPSRISTQSDGAQRAGGSCEAGTILMVCRVSRAKNIEMYLEVASQLPQFRFMLIGPIDEDADYVELVRQEIDGLGNIDWPGSASGDELLDAYRNALVFCCTSKFEGFPNTFLEAWAFGIPVISTVDPDGVITEHGLGAYVSDAKEMVEVIRNLGESAEKLARVKENCSRYFLGTHEPGVAIRRYAEEFRRLRPVD